MIVRCDTCHSRYDDAEQWTICPHGPLWAPADAYCKQHDLVNCTFHDGPANVKEHVIDIQPLKKESSGMRPETMRCVVQLHDLEIMVYRWEQAGMSDVVDQLSEHLDVMRKSLTEITSSDVMLAPVLMRGEPNESLTFTFNIHPTNASNAHSVLEDMLEIIEQASNEGRIKRS